jgi:hypothetical protein
MRNGMILLDAKGNKIPFINGSPLQIPGGKTNTYIVPHGADIKYDTQYYTEFRVDVDELADGKLDINDINSESPLITHDPIITMAMGNYVGADKKDLQKYGLILKPAMFSSEQDQDGEFGLNWAVQNNGVDEPSILGLAYALHCLKSGTFIGIDKEGHYHMHLARSAANPLGAGRSMSILADGNLKEIWGRANTDGNSWDLTAKGGIRWNVGSHNENGTGRSIEIKTDNGMYLEVGGNDDNGIAKVEVIMGDSAETVTGQKIEVYNAQDLTILGLKNENIYGSASESCQVDKSVNVLGVSTEVVVKEKQCKFGTRKTTITSGNDELTVVKGNIEETILTFGKKTTLVTTGNIEENIIAGNRKTSIKAGSYSVNVSAGSIELKTTVGSVKVSGTSVTIQGGLSVNIKAPFVRVGNGAPFGGAVTGLPGIPSYYDAITGTPLLGSMRVGIA